MDNQDTYEKGGKGVDTGAGRETAKADTATEQTGTPTAQDQSIEEERQRRQENWSPAGQTGFDNKDVERHDEIYTHEPPQEADAPAPETADR